MKIPIKPSNFTKRRYPYKFIIIHDITCRFGHLSKYLIDNKHPSISKLRADNYILYGKNNLNFHFFIEQINEDFETFVCRPTTVICEYEDIPSPYDQAIHIGMMGSYEFELPDMHFYRQMAYRAIVPVMSRYRISKNRIMLHREVATSDRGKKCPGDLFVKDKFYSELKAMLAIKQI